MMRIYLLFVLSLVVFSWSIPKPMESLTNYSVLMVHGAYGSDKGISENSEYVSAYEDTTFLGNATLGDYTSNNRITKWLAKNIFEEIVSEKGTHRHSRWFFICGPCPRIQATRHVALHVLASAYCPYRQPASGLHLPEHGQLVAVLVLLQLILDIRRNLCRIFASRVDIVAAAPKFPTLVLNLQGGKLFVQHQAALPL